MGIESVTVGGGVDGWVDGGAKAGGPINHFYPHITCASAPCFSVLMGHSPVHYRTDNVERVLPQENHK